MSDRLAGKASRIPLGSPAFINVSRLGIEGLAAGVARATEHVPPAVGMAPAGPRYQFRRIYSDHMGKRIIPSEKSATHVPECTLPGCSSER